ncbi:MAG: hypothetical protein HDS25_08315 [Bacteroides sp.]|nr:hypothetical protein [Bacteroides sp.]
MKFIKYLFFAMGLLLTIPLNSAAQSKVAIDAFETGMSAYKHEEYIKSLPYLQQAATGGVPGAFAPLIEIYTHGDYNGSGKGNYNEAFKWLLLGLTQYNDSPIKDRNLGATLLMNLDPLTFLTGDYQETVDHVTNSEKMGIPIIMPYVMCQVAASYLKLNKVSDANKWLKRAIADASEKKQNITIHTANALLAKIAYDKKDYEKALTLSKASASEGNIPLGAFVYGASLINLGRSPEVGKQWVKAAAEYDYYGIYEINCFETEIKNYWNKIKNVNF